MDEKILLIGDDNYKQIQKDLARTYPHVPYYLKKCRNLFAIYFL